MSREIGAIDYDGYNTEDGVDLNQDDLGPEYYEQASRISPDGDGMQKPAPGMNADLVADDLDFEEHLREIHELKLARAAMKNTPGGEDEIAPDSYDTTNDASKKDSSEDENID